MLVEGVEKMPHNSHSETQDSSCVFCKLSSNNNELRGLDDALIKVVTDLKPRAEYHYLVIPRVHIESWTEKWGYLTHSLNRILSLVRGPYRIQMNQGHPYREVAHCHIHIISDYPLSLADC